MDFRQNLEKDVKRFKKRSMEYSAKSNDFHMPKSIGLPIYNTDSGVTGSIMRNSCASIAFS